MSDFLMIIPEGWTEVPADWIDVSITASEAQFWITQEAWRDIEDILADYEAVPEGKHVINARLIPTELGFRLWVVFA